MESMKFFRLMRPGNCAIAAAGVFAGHAIAAHSLGLTPQLGIGMAAAFLITGAGNAINDFFDTGTDAKTGKKALQKNEMNSALTFSALLFLAGNFLAYAINLQVFAISVAVSAVLILYSGVMQGFKFIGNYVVALGTALTLVFGAAIAGNYAQIYFLAMAAFLANVAREIIKDMEDLEADKGEKNTLPMLAGFGTIKKTVFMLYLGATAIGAIALLAGIMKGIIYAALFGLSSVLLCRSFQLLAEREFRKSQEFSKFGMILALIAFVAGAA